LNENTSEKGNGSFHLNCLLQPDHPTVKPINNIIKKRRRLTSQENIVLNQVFEKYPRPPKAVKELIAKKLGMSMRCIQIWFQNRRAKAKKDTQFDPDDQLLCYVPQQASDGSDGSGRSSGGCMFGEFRIAYNSEFLSSISAVAPTSPIQFNAATALNAFNRSTKNNHTRKTAFETHELTGNCCATSSSSSNSESEISLFSPGLDPPEITNGNNIPRRILPDYFTLNSADPGLFGNLLNTGARKIEFEDGNSGIGNYVEEMNDSILTHFKFEDYLNF
jgi:hypothetical protein